MHFEKKREASIFIIATFLLTAACWLPLVLLRLPVKESGSAFSNIVYVLGGVSPAVIALLIPLITAGKGERGAYYKRYFKFAVPLRWYIIPIVSVLLLILIPYGIISVFFKDAAGMNIRPLYMIIPLFFSMIVGGGFEELGWRGILIHNLKGNNAAMIAFGTGLLWFCWHLPLFFMQGTLQYHTSVIPFLLFVLVCSFITTILYLKSGTIVPCILFHALINAFLDMGFNYGSNQLAASIADNSIKLVIAVAIFIFLNSRQLLISQNKHIHTA